NAGRTTAPAAAAKQRVLLGFVGRVRVLLFAVAARVVVATAAELLRQVVELEAARVVVRVDVTASVTELSSGQAVAGRAQHLRRAQVPVLAHVLGRLAQRP